MASDGKAPGRSGSPAEPRLSLTVVDPSGKREVVHVTRSPFKLGRLSECDLTLNDNRISRHHAQILLENGAHVIEDLESRHGVFVNGDKVERHRLHPDDSVTFGVSDSFEIIAGARPSFSDPLMKKVAAMRDPNRTGELSHLSAVLEVARTLQSANSVDDVLAAAVDAALAVTGAERGFLLLRQGAGELNLRVARDRAGGELGAHELQVPRGVIQRALYSRSDLLTMVFDPNRDAGEEEVTATETIVALDLRSAVCVPIVRIRLGQEAETSHLSAREDTLGVLYMDSRQVGEELSSAGRELIQSLAIEISSVLENARLLDESRKKQELVQELRIARDIQQAMLPAKLPETGWMTASGVSEACFDVGGDYFDVMPVDDEHWGAVMTDVSGKGVGAALLTSLLQGAFFANLRSSHSLADMFQRVNLYVTERARSTRFATVFYCLVRRDGYLRWLSAGHCPTLVLRSTGEAEWLQPTATPVGIFPESEFVEQQDMLHEGDKLILYTDGVSEARNPENEQFGEDRILEIVRAHRTEPATAILKALRAGVTDFANGAEQRDDLTLLVLDYQGSNQPQ